MKMKQYKRDNIFWNVLDFIFLFFVFVFLIYAMHCALDCENVSIKNKVSFKCIDGYVAYKFDGANSYNWLLNQYDERIACESNMWKQ